MKIYLSMHQFQSRINNNGLYIYLHCTIYYLVSWPKNEINKLGFTIETEMNGKIEY